MKTKNQQTITSFEASPLGELRRHLQYTLAMYGVHQSNDLPDSLRSLRSAWIWEDAPEMQYSITHKSCYSETRKVRRYGRWLKRWSRPPNPKHVSLA